MTQPTPSLRQRAGRHVRVFLCHLLRALQNPVLYVRVRRARELAVELLVQPGLHPQLRYMVVMYDARLELAERSGNVAHLRRTVGDVESELAEVSSLLHRGH